MIRCSQKSASLCVLAKRSYAIQKERPVEPCHEIQTCTVRKHRLPAETGKVVKGKLVYLFHPLSGTTFVITIYTFLGVRRRTMLLIPLPDRQASIVHRTHRRRNPKTSKQSRYA